jgi:myo-inositol catabolism protein IolC
MRPGYNRPLYILAFDHRTSFKVKLFGIHGEPTPEQRAQMGQAKDLIFDGLLMARDLMARDAVSPEAIAALTDEEFGFSAAQRAKAEGITLAICAEKSGTPEFELQYPGEFAEHIEALKPEFVKILARYNVEGDAGLNASQAERLARLSGWMRGRAAKFLFELIVPPVPGQLASTGGDVRRFADEFRPSLVVRAITELQDCGVEPDIWKIEGMDRSEDCARVSAVARNGCRDEVACVVLGAGAPEATVGRWLRAAAATPGYVGFAIGRTIWWDAVAGWLTGHLDRYRAASRIAGNYRRAVLLYAGANTGRTGAEGRDAACPDP